MTTKWDQLRGKVSASRLKTDEARASLAADKSENAVLSSLNKLRDQGRIKGFHVRPRMLKQDHADLSCPGSIG